MKLYNDIREKNYAYNINNSPNNFKNKKFSFDSLAKNFYEELIQKDYNIKTKRNILSEIKNNSIKESIYSNKAIPSRWKTMLNYQNKVYRIIDKDPKFANYLGRTQRISENNKFMDAQKLKNFNDKQNLENRPIPNFIKDFFKEKEPKEIKNVLSEKDLEKESINKDTLKSDIPYKKEKNDININDKLISSRLDEYRAKYDLNKYMEDIKSRRNKEKKDKKNVFIPNLKIRNTNYRQFLKSITQNDKEHVLKSTIYNNLIFIDDDKKNLTNKSEHKSKKILLKPIKPDSMFLFHNKEFDKVIEITNPKIKRDLELINYYGPRYTYCKICNNRNLEFYQNSEPNQALKLLNYLKKRKLENKSK